MDSKTTVRQGRLALMVLKLSKVSARSTVERLENAALLPLHSCRLLQIRHTVVTGRCISAALRCLASIRNDTRQNAG